MKELLKYQELDVELKKVEKKVNSSECSKKINSSKENAKKCQSRMIVINEEAKKITDEINKISQVKSKGVDLVNKYTETNLETLDEKTCLDVVNRLKPIKKNLDQLIARLSVLEINMKKLLDEFDNCKKQIIANKKIFEENKVEFDRLKFEIQPEINAIKEKMLIQEKNIKPELLSKYRNMKKDGIFPSIVHLNGKNCGYCRVEQSMHKLEEAKTKGYTECESCHRIIVE